MYNEEQKNYLRKKVGSMAENNNNNNRAPRGRQQNITGQGKDVYKRGDGLGTGPVGKTGGSSGYQGRPGTPSANRPAQNGSTGTRASGGKGSLILIAVVVIALIFGGDRKSVV